MGTFKLHSLLHCALWWAALHQEFEQVNFPILQGISK